MKGEGDWSRNSKPSKVKIAITTQKKVRVHVVHWEIFVKVDVVGEKKTFIMKMCVYWFLLWFACFSVCVDGLAQPGRRNSRWRPSIGGDSFCDPRMTLIKWVVSMQHGGERKIRVWRAFVHVRRLKHLRRIWEIYWLYSENWRGGLIKIWHFVCY